MKLKELAVNYIKYNIVGVATFSIGIVLYYTFLYGLFGEQAYLIVSIFSGFIQFSLITYLNKTKRGKMFDACKEDSSKTPAL